MRRYLWIDGGPITEEKDVPLYWADEHERGIIIRKLNGKEEKGIFKNGRFKAIEKKIQEV